MKRHLSLIILTAITAAYICPTAITDSNTISSGEKVSMSPDTEIEIQRLTAEKTRRKRTAAIWDGLNIGFVFLAGVAAVGLVVTSIGLSRSNDALAESSEELSHTKDLRAEGEIAATMKLANDAGVRAGNLEVEAGRQRARAAKAESDLLEVKKSLEPRRLTAEQKDKLVSLFKSFGATSISVAWCDAAGGEAIDLASDFIGAAQAAAITIKSAGAIIGGCFRGFELRAGANRTLEATKIVTFLTENGFSQSPVPIDLSTGDPNNLAILVGIKP
jgi:hypothetical protein